MKQSGAGGVIINVSLTAGLQGFAAEPTYAVSKCGVRGLTKAAALKFAPLGIKVVSVHPGVVETPPTTDVQPESCDHQPIPRIGRTSEVTALIVFLAAEVAYSNGTE